ncbi:hypothetical protein GCM10010197_42560 [Nocardioides luteus]|uniref:Uncharacterized protein n=1 Tax=Nocardioides luteus TaxID=1844 RepID=A0ABQ5T3C1_9ACTN|nr:hypothetical protein GCM10010197_42560 [Nocardioides luteus]GLJ70556.1 hypothetical protein GCM10017579_45920 [Nocardioides luteus]
MRHKRRFITCRGRSAVRDLPGRVALTDLLGLRRGLVTTYLLRAGAGPRRVHAGEASSDCTFLGSGPNV